MAIRILITDDHAVVRQGLRMFLSLDPEIEVVGEAQDGQEALAMARELKPDVVLMDLLMPLMDGIEATTIIRSELPEVEVIALTSVLEDASVSEAVKAGAIGYLLKDTDAEELHRAIRGAAEGRVQLAPEAAARLMREVRAPKEEKEKKEKEKKKRSPQQEQLLTEREREVLRLLARGKANKQIAAALFVSEKTVKAHVSSILMKLGVNSRTQAALYALRTGLVRTDELGGEEEEQEEQRW